MFSHRRPHQRAIHRRLVLAAMIAANLGVLAGPAVASAPPIHKIYDCWGFTGQTAFSTWVQSVELKTRTTYLVGATRKGNRVVGDVARGHYRVRGKRITWISGPYAHHHMWAIYHGAGKGYIPHKENEVDKRFDIYKSGLNILECYEH